MAATNGISDYKTIEQIIQSTKENLAATRKTGGDLGKNDFLNLLVTQLRYQDPLEPTDDKAFIAQMAQFSSLEQMQNMNGVMTNSQAFSLIGKDVTASITDPKTFDVKTVTGLVSTVRVSNGKTYLMINNQQVEADKVVEVNDNIYNTNTNLAAYTNLIGFKVRGAVYDSSNGEYIYLSGNVKEIQKGTHEDYAVMDDVTVNVAEITGATSADPNFMKNYLETNKGKQVKLTIKDPDSGYRVPVTVTLKDYSIDESTGKITATVNDLYVSVYSVSNIQKQKEESTAGEAGGENTGSTTGN
ncbi:flagellar basal body rod modification protein [Ruminiclostridium hungatei]|uniref:Basal-body rod modification protein FlgD n=1 Tax=Ruminiclostridium hungatei TaxID=48256 RepID=A0A1V4SM61_RUMHU|nr:flagellar hook capping FlgD N-terminal domain-containing protein [Ruminiclostridium hungatei]OPX44586.1 flagellar basal body rod modification protein [Ruminiclostridium hungatei]